MGLLFLASSLLLDLSESLTLSASWSSSLGLLFFSFLTRYLEITSNDCGG